MVKTVICRMAILGAVAGLAGCTLPPPSGQAVSMISSQQVEGRVEPVYNPPPGTPFRCVNTRRSVDVFRIPGDVNTGLPTAFAPVATLGYRRGDWLEVVAKTGIIGWIFMPVEPPMSQNDFIRYCHVYQDAQGRIVFDYKFWNTQF
jgi:hypothetical protein